MKKFDFSLQKVLEIKQQLLKNLKVELNNMNQHFKNLEIEKKNLNDKYDETNKKLNERLSVSMTIGEISYYKMFMNSILKQIEKKEEEKIALNKKIEAKRREIIGMNIEISSIEKLKEKEYAKYTISLAKSEEIFIEEFVSNTRMLKQFMF